MNISITQFNQEWTPLESEISQIFVNDIKLEIKDLKIAEMYKYTAKNAVSEIADRCFSKIEIDSKLVKANFVVNDRNRSCALKAITQYLLLPEVLESLSPFISQIIDYLLSQNSVKDVAQFVHTSLERKRIYTIALISIVRHFLNNGKIIEALQLVIEIKDNLVISKLLRVIVNHYMFHGTMMKNNTILEYAIKFASLIPNAIIYKEVAKDIVKTFNSTGNFQKALNTAYRLSLSIEGYDLSSNLLEIIQSSLLRDYLDLAQGISDTLTNKTAQKIAQTYIRNYVPLQGIKILKVIDYCHELKCSKHKEENKLTENQILLQLNDETLENTLTPLYQKAQSLNMEERIESMEEGITLDANINLFLALVSQIKR